MTPRASRFGRDAMTNQDKNHQKDQRGGKPGTPRAGIDREQERQEEQRQQEKGRDTKPGGRNDDQSKQPGHH
jgi:hypothetical protein